MATLPTKSFASVSQSIQAGMQGRTPKFLNFATGSVFKAIAEAFAGGSVWLQYMVLSLVKITRLSTSTGADADSFVADFGIIQRIGAVAATGLVNFSRYTPSGANPVVALGSKVQTSDGKQTFVVYKDSSNPRFSLAASGYVMPAQVLSISVPVISVTPSTTNKSGNPGLNGNVLANSLTKLASSVPGIDAVTNPSNFINGLDEEPDPALKVRFRSAIAALSKATDGAIELAVQSLQTGMQVKVLGGRNLDGSLNPGMVTVIVDDGSGSMSDLLLRQCRAAVRPVIGSGMRLGLFKARRQDVLVRMTVSVLDGYIDQDVRALVRDAVATNINSLSLGDGLGYLRVGKWALEVPGVDEVDNLLVNGLAGVDIPLVPQAILRCSGVVVS